MDDEFGYGILSTAISCPHRAVAITCVPIALLLPSAVRKRTLINPFPKCVKSYWASENIHLNRAMHSALQDW
jgi:hypothetical protein